MSNPIMEIPTEYKRLFDSDWREAAIYGGRSSLKSHTVARFLLIKARRRRTRVGCFREMQNSIAESSHQLLKDLIIKYGLTDFIVTDNSIVNSINGSDFLFKGLFRNDQSIKSIEGIDIAWVEEAQTVSEKSIEVLTPTIRKPGSQIIYTYNRLEEEDPVHKRLVIEGRPNTLIINVNYDIAIKYDMMPEVLRLEMEDDKAKRLDLYKHKWLGEPMAMSEQRIFKGWVEIDEIPHHARLERRGVDFGYSNDPTTIIDIYKYDGGYIWDEVLYQKGMSNKRIADTILEQEQQCLVVADSAEPKSIDEIRSYGVNIVGAVKKKEETGSKKTYKEWSIQLVQDQRISYTRRSVNLKREYRNYLWKLDKDGNVMVNPSIPDHDFSHTMDAGEYGMVSVLSQPKFNMPPPTAPLKPYFERMN
jgi:PBSX family phage terminase large subunit